MPFRICCHLLLLSSLSLSCRPAGKAGEEAATADEFADFAEFYERFHTDSLYQMAHISFPITGLPSNADSTARAGDSFRWEPGNWRMHRRIDFTTSDFSQKLTAVSDDLIVEEIIHQSGQYAIKRHFTRWEDEWYLTHYVGLNPVSKRPPKSSGIDIRGGF